MATIKCPNCGKEVNDLNSRCTGCGQLLPKGEPENNQDVNDVQNNTEKRKKISKNSFGFKVLVYVIFIFVLTFISTYVLKIHLLCICHLIYSRTYFLEECYK